MGKALAAWLPARELDGIIARTVFARQTPRTITTPSAFRRELARIRTSGFAVDNEEHIAGIRCIATPIRDHSGDVRALLCVVGPTSRFPQRRLAEIRAALAAVAVDLSAQLGYASSDKAAWVDAGHPAPRSPRERGARLDASGRGTRDAIGEP